MFLVLATKSQRRGFIKFKVSHILEATFYVLVVPVQLTISINTVSPNVSALFRLGLLRGASAMQFYWHRFYVALCTLRHFPFYECYGLLL